MGLGSFFKDVGHVAAGAVNDVSSGLNVVDRYINPFHTEKGSAQSGDNSGNSFLGNMVNHTVEDVSQKLTWVYDNGISQPISTAMMAGNLPGGPLSAHNWAVSWHAANHISPAQALFLNPKQTQAAVNSPLEYYKPGAAYLPPDFDTWPQDRQQEFLKNAGMPAIGNQYINELRQTHRFFSNASGLGDFALRWVGDPLVLAGKAYSADRSASQIVRRPTERLTLGRTPNGPLPVGIVRKPGGWSGQDINRIMDSSSMGKAVDFIWQNRDNPALLNNLQMVRQSGMGPRFGSIAGVLKSPDEVHDFIRVGLGDVDAVARLQSKNQLAAARIAQETSRVSQLGLMADQFEAQGTARSAQYAQMARNEIDASNDRINADVALVRGYNQVLDHANEIDAVNLSRWSAARAQARTADQLDYRARAARGIQAQGLRADAQGMRRVSVTPTPFLSRGDTTPVDLGLVKNRVYGIGDYFSSPITMVRSLGTARPNGYVRLDDVDAASVAEVRGQIARIPGISGDVRMNLLNGYLKANNEGERLAVLKDIGATGAAKVAEKHGLDPEVGLDIYQKHLESQSLAADNLKRYSAAKKTITTPDGQLARINVDEFALDGGKVVMAPNLVTKLMNDHVFQDLDQMDKVLARHSSALRAIRTSRLGNPDWISDASDYLTSVFKFGTLARLGYIPRVASDDLAGQVARLGAATMAMRAGWGVRNGITNLALWRRPAFYAAQQASALEGVRYANEELASVEPELNQLRQQIEAETAMRGRDAVRAQARLEAAQARVDALGEDIPQARRTAAQRYLQARQAELERAQERAGTAPWPTKQTRLQALQDDYDHLTRMRDESQAAADQAALGNVKRTQATKPVDLGNGITAPAAFSGKEGEMYQKLVSSDEVLGQIFATNKQLVHGHLMRSFDHGGKAIRAADDEALHAQSWAHAINAQIMQDPLAVQAVRGASPQDLTKWLTRTAEGRAYRERLGLKVATNEDIANSAWHEAAEYLPTPEIRAKALEPDGVTPAFLKEAVPMVHRPEVHTGQIGQATRKYVRAMDGVMDRWYKVAASLPADRLSRHPLFNQLYEGHLKTLRDQLTKQGAYDTSVEGIEKMATTARRLALRDTRGLVFDIAHRSDAAAALRFISPFMSATTESFQRWGRIIADKPQTVGYANAFFNAPIAKGSMQDADGNRVDRNGYAYTIDPNTGRAVKTLVPKSQRYIVGRMPKWLVQGTGGRYSPFAAAFGLEPSSRNFKLSQNSMDLVTQGDPWFHPGVGPIVQIPVNQLVKDKPKAAEIARRLQILPFGPQNGGPFGTGPTGEAASFLLPSAIKNFMTAFDTSDARYQDIKLQILQRAAFEHDQLGKPMPSPKQIASMVKDYWLFSAESAFLQPMATQRKDAYQFYRDQYNALRRQNPLTADDEFLNRFGESYFVFAQSQSKNDSGIPATMKAVELEKKYGNLIAQNPELGALIVGPEGNGPFSPEAYSYQLNTPVTPGGAEMQRTKMSADDAMKENQRRLGWSKFTAFMNALTAQLHNRGLQSFQDKGAEDLHAAKQAFVQLIGSPTTPDGEANPYYNAAWSEDYNTLDPLKYERLIPGLQAVARSPLANQSSRSDLRVLQSYLGARQGITQLLAARKAAGGSNVITAKSNADVLEAWQRYVDGLIESDTNFGDLHSRYLARDLGYDGSLEGAAA